MKGNGHDAGTARVNGHGPASPSRAAQEMEAPLETSRAASDDARDIPAAAAASSAVAGMERDACAEVAEAQEGEKNRRPKMRANGSAKAAGRRTSRVSGEENRPNSGARDERRDQANDKGDKNTVHIPPGSEPLAENGPDFVDALHEHVDLYLACARLLKSEDEKIAQRMAERLLEMKYGKATSAPAEESPEIVIDIDSAVVRRAAEGAQR